MTIIASSRLPQLSFFSRLTAGLLLVTMTPLLPNLCAADAELATRQRQQQETLEMARALLTDVIDIQIQQFTENGLDQLPVFNDIRQMRGSIDQVSEADMQAIIVWLKQAQSAPPVQQSELVGQAREKARHVATVLIAQRQQLQQRLQAAQLQAQLRQMVQRQQRVLGDTKRLRNTPRPRQDQATLSTLEDQRDLHTFFDEMVKSLESFPATTGKEAQAARAAKEDLQRKATSEHFDGAEASLIGSEFENAQLDQQSIVEDLLGVLERFDALHGLRPLEVASTIERVDALRQEQQQVLEQTKATAAGDEGRLDQLSEQQHKIWQQLGELIGPESGLSGDTPQLHAAQDAALTAETKLFEGDRPQAVTQQERVISELDALTEILERTAQQPPDTPFDNLPFEEFNAQQITQLQQLSDNLTQIAADQQQVIADTAAQPQSAGKLETEVAKDLAQEAGREPLPESVHQAVQNAADEALQAAQIMQSTGDSPSRSATAAARQVEQAIQAAQTLAAAQLQAAQAAAGQSQALAQMQATPAGESAAANQQAAQNSANAPAQGPPSSVPTTTEQTNSNATASQRKVGDAQRVADDRDAGPGGRSADAPWFARLPLELREAIRMQGRRQPPRAYEQRLRRYFESVDRPPLSEGN